MTVHSSSIFLRQLREPQHAQQSQIDCRPMQVRREGKLYCRWRSRCIYLVSRFLLMERVHVANFPISNLSLEYTPTEDGGFRHLTVCPLLIQSREALGI